MLCRMCVCNDDVSTRRFSVDGNFNIRLCFGCGNVKIVNGVGFSTYIYIFHLA